MAKKLKGTIGEIKADSEACETDLICISDAIHRLSLRFLPAENEYEAELRVSNEGIIQMILQQYPSCEPDAILVNAKMEEYGFVAKAVALDDGVGLRFLLKDKV